MEGIREAVEKTIGVGTHKNRNIWLSEDCRRAVEPNKSINNLKNNRVAANLGRGRNALYKVLTNTVSARWETYMDKLLGEYPRGA